MGNEGLKNSRLKNFGIVAFVIGGAYSITYLMGKAGFIASEDSTALGMFVGGLAYFAADVLVKGARERSIKELESRLSKELDNHREGITKELDAYRTSLNYLAASERGKIVAQKQADFFHEYMTCERRWRERFADEMDTATDANWRMMLAWSGELSGIRTQFIGWLEGELDQLLQEHEGKLREEMVKFKKNCEGRADGGDRESIDKFLLDLLEEPELKDGRALSDWCREKFGVEFGKALLKTEECG